MRQNPGASCQSLNPMILIPNYLVDYLPDLPMAVLEGHLVVSRDPVQGLEVTIYQMAEAGLSPVRVVNMVQQPESVQAVRQAFLPG